MNYITPKFNTDRYTAAAYDIAIATAAAPFVGVGLASGAVIGVAIGVSGELVRELERENIIKLGGKKESYLRSIATLFAVIVISGLASYLIGLPILGFKTRVVLALTPTTAELAYKLALKVKQYFCPSKGWSRVLQNRY